MTRPLPSVDGRCLGSCRCHGIAWDAKGVAA